ncbi:MAG TPA: hypothetical protein VFO29_11860 [Candidatus Rubrimentiphilum sp.]|nr:hypothetical protein [Candidatus Rubrimentiphilum sp.]
MNFIQSFGAWVLALGPTIYATRFAIGQTRCNLGQDVTPKGRLPVAIGFGLLALYLLHFGHYGFWGAQFCAAAVVLSGIAAGVTWLTGKPAREARDRDAVLLAQGEARARRALDMRDSL